MINQKVIQEFLNRSLADFDWVKTTSERAIDRHLSHLRPVPDFNGIKPWVHQKGCFAILNESERFIFHINMGGGKTLLTLMFLRYKKQCGLNPRAIVFVPYLTAVETWVDECAKHTPDLKCVPLLGTGKENLAALQGDGDLFVICYQSAVAMLADKRTPTKWTMPPGSVAANFKSFNFLVCDEIHKCFVKGTMIATPTGPKPIEELRQGDLVETGFGARPVLSTMCNTSLVLVEITLSNGIKVTSTPDHLFMTNEGWVRAERLYEKQVSFAEPYYTYEVRSLWDRVPCNAQAGTGRPQVLFKELRQKAQQPHKRPSRSFKDIISPHTQWAWVGHQPWGEWEVNAPTNTFATSLRERLADRICNIVRVSPSWLPKLLQGGYWQQGPEDCHRSGWWGSQPPTKPKQGPEKKCQTSRIRVVNVSVLEQNYPETVFNIEVDEHPYYFANGILVHNCKSHKSLSYQLAKAISAHCTWAIGLTGTPFGKDLQDLWPQFYLIDFGETLGKTLSLYREAFFTSKVNYWGGWEWKFKPAMMPKLHQTIKNRSIHYRIDEFTDMPPKVYVPKRLALPEASRGYVKIAMDKMREALKGGEQGAYQVVESQYLQLRQLASGFLTLKDDEQRLQIRFDENPKLELLQDLIEQMPPQCKMVVFHWFIYTNGMISEMLTKMKVRHARIWGGQKDPIEQLRRFKNDAACRVLVINSKSGSSSLNLQNANYVTFFEQPDSPIDRQQAEARCWRPGQEKRVIISDLLMHGTMDERIYHANKAGETLLKALLEGKQKL